MEKLQGPILHPSLHLFDEHLEAGCSLEDEMGINNYGELMNYRFEDPHCTIFPSLEDNMPFLQMLQGVVAETEAPPPFPLMQQPNFQLLLRLQQEKLINMKSCFANELQSCVTNNNDTKAISHESNKGGRSVKKMGHLSKLMCNSEDVLIREDGGGGGRKKRKRGARPSKNKEQVESQRMTHIAVERNRRRQMNEHLNALRSLMPPSYIQRGDQASIIGGAIDFVKELEQLLQSLQAQKRMRQSEDNNLQQNVDVSANTSTSTSSSSNLLSNMFMGLSSSSSSSPSSSTLQIRNPENALQEDQTLLCAENRSSIGDIEVVVIQNHVNMKIQCQRRPGQLIKAIVGLEDLRLSVLHLNITSFRDLVLYSFNLKIEEDCKLGSADEVATAVHQIFSFINLTSL